MPTGEDAPLLIDHNNHSDGNNYSTPYSSSGSKSHAHLKGSIAGTYSLLGGFGILLLTKAGGALFDVSGPSAPFYMMASFNALLLVVGTGVSVWEVVRGWRKKEHDVR